MAAGEITIRLNLDDDKFTAKVEGATKELNRLRSSLLKNNKPLKDAARHTKSFGSQLRDATIVMGLAASAIRNLNVAIFGLPRQITQANAELERMQFLMAGLQSGSKEFSAALQQASGEVKELFRISSESPFDVSSVTDSFVKMKAAGLDPLSGQLQGLLDSVARFGGTSQQLKRASIAIQQMAGKGVISMEELRQQLGEAVPNAMMIMSRAVGMNMGDMVKVISEGRMEADSALKLLARQMRIENVGAARQMAQTFDGLMNRLSNSWTQLSKTVGDAGFFAEVKGQLRDLVNAMNSEPAFQQMAISAGQSLAIIVRGLSDLIKLTYEMRDVLMFAVKAFALWKAAAIANSKILVPLRAAQVGYAASVASTTKEMIAAQKAMMASIGVQGRVKTSVIATAAKMQVLRTAFVGLATTVWAFVWPLAAVTAAVWAMEKAYYALIGRKKELTEISALEADQVTDDQLALLKEELVKIDAARMDLDAQIKKIVAGNDSIRSQRLRNEGAVLEKQAIEVSERIASIYEAKLNRKITRASNDALVLLGQELKPIADRYTQDLIESRERIEALKGENTDEKVAEAKVALEKRYGDQVTAVYRNQMNGIKEILDTGLENDEKIGANRRKVLSGVLTAMYQEEQQFQQTLAQAGGVAKILDPRGAENKLTKVQTAIASYTKRVAKLEAAAEGAAPELAQLNVRLAEGGDLAGATKEEAATLIELAKSFDRLKQAADVEKILDRITKQMARTGSQIKKLSVQNATDNPWTIAQASVMQYSEQIKAMQLQVKKAEEKYNEMGEAAKASFKSAKEELSALLQQAEKAGIDKVFSNMTKETLKINQGLMTSNELLDFQYARNIRQVDEWTAAQVKLNEVQIQGVIDYKDALQKQLAFAKSPMKRLIRDWSDTTAQFDNLWANSMGKFVDELANAFVEGRFEVKDFMKFLAKEIIKIQLMKLAAGIADSFNFGQKTSTAESPQGVPKTTATATYSALGNVMTSDGPLTLNKYARGGIANSPQVSIFGEGSQPEAYVPLPDGRSIPVTMSGGGGDNNVQVNVINQTREEVNAEQSGGRFDGEKFVVDVVLKNMTKPGPMRDMMRGSR